MDAMLNIGASKGAVDAARRAILDILRTPADQDTKRIALQALTSVCEVKNNIVSYCNFSASPPPKSVTVKKK
jgi:hypothetical protein